MKKKSKLIKVLSMMMCLVLACSMLGGCGGNDEAKDGNVKISVSHFPDKDAEPERYKQSMDKIKRFNEEYPDIEIEGLVWSFDTKTFVAQAEGGTLPTVTRIPFTEGKKLMELGYAKDLTDYLKKNDYFDKINPDIMENISMNGSVYYIPCTMYSMGLMMNLNLFREAGLIDEDENPIYPKTFEELIETARTITEKTGKPGFIMPSSNNAGGWVFTVLAWNFGADFMKETKDGWKATFDSKECVEALQYIKDLKWKYKVLPDNALINNSESFKMIAVDEGAMLLMHPNVTNTICTKYGMDPNSLGMAPMPAGKDDHYTLIGGEYYMIKPGATDAETEAVFKWLGFEDLAFELTDDVKKNIRSSYEEKKAINSLVGINDISIWGSETEVEKFKAEAMKEYLNVDYNHIRAFNEQKDMAFRSEEPKCAQELYALLDKCIQAVLTDKNADCKALLADAAKNFQSNYLDYEN